jgi:VWFA-related protein
MKNIAQQLKKFFITSASKTFLFFFFFILICNSSLEAGPFLKIDRIDAESEFPKINIFITIKENDKVNISGLNEENISIYEDGFLANYIKVKKLTEKENTLYMVLAVDSSKSISAKLLQELKNSADELLNLTDSSDMTALYRFNDETILLNNFTNNRVEVIKNINKIERHGTRTLFYDTLYEAIKLLNKTEVPRKALLVFTDGKDEGSSAEINDVINFAKNSRIPIYCITVNPQNRIKLLSRLTLVTDGKLYNPDKNNLNIIYKNIIRAVKSQYQVEYKTMLQPDGKTHTVETRFKYNNLKDKEQVSITFKSPSSSFWFPITREAILIALIIILIIILIIFVICIYIKLQRVSKTPFPSQKVINANEIFFEDKKTDSPVSSDAKEKTADKKEIQVKAEELIHINAWLVERDGINAGKKIQIQHEETTIGRDSGNRILIEDKSVSKKHAKIKLIKNSFYLFDMASDKGTYLNENKLLRPKLLYDWDEIRIGKKLFIFRISNVA